MRIKSELEDDKSMHHYCGRNKYIMVDISLKVHTTCANGQLGTSHILRAHLVNITFYECNKLGINYVYIAILPESVSMTECSRLVQCTYRHTINRQTKTNGQANKQTNKQTDTQNTNNTLKKNHLRRLIMSSTDDGTY